MVVICWLERNYKVRCGIVWRYVRIKLLKLLLSVSIFDFGGYVIFWFMDGLVDVDGLEVKFSLELGIVGI